MERCTSDTLIPSSNWLTGKTCKLPTGNGPWLVLGPGIVWEGASWFGPRLCYELFQQRVDDCTQVPKNVPWHCLIYCAQAVEEVEMLAFEYAGRVNPF